jgi:hypothetical protein
MGLQSHCHEASLSPAAFRALVVRPYASGDNTMKLRMAAFLAGVALTFGAPAAEAQQR